MTREYSSDAQDWSGGRQHVLAAPDLAALADRSGVSVSGVTGNGAITAGSGGTDGTFALGFTGGTGTAATGTFTVAAGALTAISITTPGAYSVVPSAFDFSASAGLGGGATASVTTAVESHQIMAANAARKGWKLQNTSDTAIWYNDTGGAASVGGAGCYSIAAGATYESPLYGASVAAISIFCATINKSFSAAEW